MLPILTAVGAQICQRPLWRVALIHGGWVGMASLVARLPAAASQADLLWAKDWPKESTRRTGSFLLLVEPKR
ncbi:hypothetical protein BH23ACT2_BH23ACT2_11050 [soil metagenome]